MVKSRKVSCLTLKIVPITDLGWLAGNAGSIDNIHTWKQTVFMRSSGRRPSYGRLAWLSKAGPVCNTPWILFKIFVTFGPFVSLRSSPLKFKGFWPVSWTEHALLQGTLFQTMSLAEFLRYHHRTFLQFTADSQQIYRIENWKALGNMGICIKQYEVEKVRQ